jgi:FtsH-binding integral membrane protein
MSVRTRGWVGFGLAAAGLALFLTAMFTGLNEYPEGSFPGWLKVLQALGAVLLLAGLVTGFAIRPRRGRES